MHLLIKNPIVRNLTQTVFAAVNYPIALITIDLKNCIFNSRWQSLNKDEKDIYNLFKFQSILESWPQYQVDSLTQLTPVDERVDIISLDVEGEFFKVSSYPLYWKKHLKGMIVTAHPLNLNELKGGKIKNYGDLEDFLRAQYKALQKKNVSLMAFIEPLTRTIGTLLSNNSDEASSTFRSHLNMLHLKNFIENVPVVCAMFDNQMNYLMLSKPWHAFAVEKINLPNYPTTESMIGKNHYEVAHITPQHLKDVHYRCLKGASERSEGEWYRDVHGNIRWIRWECFPWYEDKGEIGGIIIFLEDITERKNTEKHLERMKHTNALLEYFADICSHDLKQPVRTIGNFTQILLEEYGPRLEEKAKHYLNEINAGAKRLYELIDSILAYTKIDIDTKSLKSVSLEEIISTVVADLDALIREKNGQVITNNLPVIFSHQAILYHVFQNLISNALKFSSSKRPVVEIEVKLLNGCWCCSVKDNGIGIPPEFHQNIFEMYWRYQKKKNLAGSGIGLAVCKRVIEALGGDIWVESSSSQGTTFMFTLPNEEAQS